MSGSDYAYILPMERSVPGASIVSMLGIVFFLLAAAAAFIYFADSLEEYPRICLNILKVEFIAVFLIHLSLLFEKDAPRLELFISICSHIIYSLHLLSFPYVSLGSYKSLTSFSAFVLCHIIWFNYFKYHNAEDIFTLAVFYFVMVWLIPFSLSMFVRSSDLDLPVYSQTVRASSYSTPSKNNSNSSFSSALSESSPLSFGSRNKCK